MTLPERIGRYEIEGELGKGAMGVVYLARDPLIGRQLAIKTFSLAYPLGDKELEIFRERFLIEARSAGRLNHPNIVTIHDVMEDESTGHQCIAMEYVKGVDLKQKMRKKLELPWVLDIVAQIAEGLAFAHTQKVVHRDVKPANIIITPEQRAKITDFGIARVDAASNLTAKGQLLGTPNYMSPEQIRGENVDHRADLFSLGVMLYELVTGKKPFQGDNLTAVTHRIVYDSFPPPEEIIFDLPPAIGSVIARALEKEADKRYQDGLEMARDLRAMLAPGTATPSTTLSGSPTLGGTATAGGVIIGAATIGGAGSARPVAGLGETTGPQLLDPGATVAIAAQTDMESMAAQQASATQAITAPTAPATRPPPPASASTETVTPTAPAALPKTPPPVAAPTSAPSAPPQATPAPSPPRAIPTPNALSAPPQKASPKAAPPQTAPPKTAGTEEPAAAAKQASPPAERPPILRWIAIAVVTAIAAVTALQSGFGFVQRGVESGAAAPPQDMRTPWERAGELMTQAESTLARGQLSDAELEQVRSTGERARLWRNNELRAIRLYDRANAELERRQPPDPSFQTRLVEGMLAHADALLESDQQEALEVLELALTIDPDNAEAAAMRRGTRRVLDSRQREAQAEQVAQTTAPLPTRPAAPPPPPVVREGVLTVTFRTDIAEGKVEVFAGGTRLVNETFSFPDRRRKGLIGKKRLTRQPQTLGPWDLTVEPGGLDLRVQIQLFNDPPITRTVSGEMAPGGARTLGIVISDTDAISVRLE